jgi:hypothetical protein
VFYFKVLQVDFPTARDARNMDYLTMNYQRQKFFNSE